MSSNQQIPPLVQEQLAKLQQTQQNLQSILGQKQQLEFVIYLLLLLSQSLPE